MTIYYYYHCQSVEECRE